MANPRDVPGACPVSTLADRDAPPAEPAGPFASIPTALTPALDGPLDTPGVDTTAPSPTRTGIGGIVRAYVALTKPPIVELLLITTVPTMFLARHGVPPLWLIAVVVVGGALAAGSANALNCYIDRDIDQVMKRTSRRPLPRHQVAPTSALWFGLVLGAVAIALLAATTNVLTTALTLGANLYYVVVYTLLLKRRTVHNTVLGGICGAAPVLIGWAAVTGTLSWRAWALFAVMFLWQPPHFWALAIKFRHDYARAGIPMLPVVRSLRRTSVETVVYAWLTVAASLALWPLGMTPVYGVTALVAGAAFIVEAHRLDTRVRRAENPRPMRLFHWSITYLTVLFVAVALDALLS